MKSLRPLGPRLPERMSMPIRRREALAFWRRLVSPRASEVAGSRTTTEPRNCYTQVPLLVQAGFTANPSLPEKRHNPCAAGSSSYSFLPSYLNLISGYHSRPTSGLFPP